MALDDLIYGLVTLLILAAIILKPWLKKKFPPEEKEVPPRRGPGRDPEWIEALRGAAGPEELTEFIFTPPEEARPVLRHTLRIEEPRASSISRIEALSSMKKAVIWKEILDKPAGLKDLEPPS